MERVDLINRIKRLNNPKVRRYGCYLYFLFDGEELVYIGKSINPIARIESHKATKKFNTSKYTYLYGGGSHHFGQLCIEGSFIRFLRPKYNCNWQTFKFEDSEDYDDYDIIRIRRSIKMWDKLMQPTRLT